MRRLALIGIVFALIATACGGSTDDSAGDTTTATDEVQAPSDSSDEQDENASDAGADVEDPTAEPEPDPTATAAPEPTATPVPEPVVINAIGIGLDSERMFDFAAQEAPDADINATLVVGSPLKIVFTSIYGFQPGCLGATLWDEDFVALIEGYFAIAAGGCDSMPSATMFPVATVLFSGPHVIVIEIGEMPNVPFVLAYQWVDLTGANGFFRNSPETWTEPGDIPSIAGADVVVAPTGPPFMFEKGFETGDLSSWSSVPAAREFPVPGTCTADDQTLCLGNDRFAVQVDWTDGAESGPGTVFTGSGEEMEFDDSGRFAFVNPDAWLLLVRVMNGCETNDGFWFYIAALSSVGYDVTVTDTLSGETKSYTGPLDSFAEPVLDDSAFTTCP